MASLSAVLPIVRWLVLGYRVEKCVSTRAFAPTSRAKVAAICGVEWPCLLEVGVFL